MLSEPELKGLRLLISHLDPTQRQDFFTTGHFFVRGGLYGTKYRLGNSYVTDESNHYCLAVAAYVVGDQILGRKLFIDAAEHTFLNTVAITSFFDNRHKEDYLRHYSGLDSALWEVLHFNRTMFLP